VTDNIIPMPERPPEILLTIAITRFSDGTIRAGFERMPKHVIETTGRDVAERVEIIAGWIHAAAEDMDRQADGWAKALYGDCDHDY